MIRVGDKIRIISMRDEPQYSGKVGTVYAIDGIGQIHGTWGGLAIVPNEDKFELIKEKECDICGKTFTEYGNNPSPIKADLCCNECNEKLVVPLRIFQTIKNPKFALLLATDGTLKTVEPKERFFNLKELQTNVDGLIEMYPTYWQGNYIVCNEEGLLKGMEYNSIAKLILNVDLVGPVLVVPRHLLDEED
jgi:hypothetical protein